MENIISINFIILDPNTNQVKPKSSFVDSNEPDFDSSESNEYFRNVDDELQQDTELNQYESPQKLENVSIIDYQCTIYIEI